MRRLLPLLVAACTGAPAAPDAGPKDAGLGPQQHCVASSCDVEGVWLVAFTGVPAMNPVCRPVEDQLRFTSDGGTVCMLEASDGGGDGGCGLEFVVRWRQDAGSDYLDGTDVWGFDVPDAGHLYGTWKTQVTGVSNCSATYAIHAVR